jgi:hypothetical protein
MPNCKKISKLETRERISTAIDEARDVASRQAKIIRGRCQNISRIYGMAAADRADPLLIQATAVHCQI